MAKYRLFFDQRAWSNGSLVVEARNAEEALRLYDSGMLENRIESIAWDVDDIEVSIIDVEEQTAEIADFDRTSK